MDHRMVLVRHRPGELATDKEVRKIGDQRQIWEAIEQVEDEIEIGRHPIAMRLDPDRNAGLLAEPQPAFDQGDAILQSPRPDVRLEVDVMHRTPAAMSRIGFRSSTVRGKHWPSAIMPRVREQGR